MFREMVLGVGTHPVVSGVIKRYGLGWGASRFVAGEELADAIAVAEAIGEDNIMVTLDHLGESVTRAEEAKAALDSCLEILDAIAERGVAGNISVKLTQLGLAFDQELARSHLTQIVERAAQHRNFVRIDMEDSPYTTVTLDLYREMSARYPEHVGVVLQAYLYRTQDDLQALSDMPRNFRIVKGAYQEPVAVAFPVKSDVDANYFRLVTSALEAGHYVAVATHDEEIIGRVLQYVHHHGVPRDRFEFQMLYGVHYSVLKGLAKEGYRCRVYLPYGRDWYAYYLRRIAERPANLLFFARTFLDRR